MPIKSEKLFPIMVFADGASSGNPGPGGWGSIIIRPDGHVTELGGPDPSTTNNRMELMAVIRALDKLGQVDWPIDVFTDSVYVIRGITQWIWGWRKKGWKSSTGEEVANQDLWKQLSGAVAGKKIEWKFVRGHKGIPGNERVDAIAVEFSKGRRPALYEGSLLQYNVAVHDLPDSFELPEMKPQVAKPVAFSYLSLLGNTPMRHTTWADCERRVKGRSGAKFKKALNAEEEEAILRSWGFQLKDLPK